MHTAKLLLLPITALALATAGCGEDAASQSEVEANVKTQLTKQVGTAPKAISCPGDLKAEVGEKMTCTLTAPDDSEVDVAVTVTSVDGDRVKYSIEVGRNVRR